MYEKHFKTLMKVPLLQPLRKMCIFTNFHPALLVKRHRHIHGINSEHLNSTIAEYKVHNEIYIAYSDFESTRMMWLHQTAIDL